MSITEFLLARIVADEGVALVDSIEMSRSAITIQFDCGTQELFTPTRALAECAAKREIVELHRIGVDPCDAHDLMFNSIECETIHTLAAIYADHPDYQQEWSVSP
ncbi:DUF6221 family protein [Arthrobacter roseus]|uniref:DUF6221 family protein n=1 Tax=Arthrobacter roseus TaxID=136274 RepID=UPI00196316FB|nr:hypothetical protein [Arthrobacter roseus]